jgi:alkylhydroperoxidase family enzyme
VKLSQEPAALTATDLAPLRAAGLSALAILDLSYVVGMFTWANQLFLSLGAVERTEPIAQEQ